MTREAAGRPELDPGAGLTERYESVTDGRRIRTVVAGDGPGPLVLFEAGMSAPAAEWLPVQRAVSRRARTLSYDRAGYGGSDVDRDDHTLERMVDDLTALLDGIGETAPMVLVAHSWGGPIIRLFAHRHPERVAGIVFVEGTLAEVMSPRQATLVKLSFHLTSVLVRIGATGLIRRMVLPHGASPEISEADMAILWRDYASVRAMRAGSQEAKQVKLAHPLMKKLQAAGTPDVPTIALQGGRVEGGSATRAFRQGFTDATGALMAARPHGEMIVVADAGHLIPQEQPSAVIEAIFQVLDRV